MWHWFLTEQWYPVWPNLEASALWDIPLLWAIVWSHLKLREHIWRSSGAAVSQRPENPGSNAKRIRAEEGRFRVLRKREQREHPGTPETRKETE
jgi:hypothetical protein